MPESPPYIESVFETIAETFVDGLLNLMIVEVPAAFILSSTSVNTLKVILTY